MPNINPDNYQTGPFPDLKGRIINENEFYSEPDNPDKAYIITNLTTAITTAHHINLISKDLTVPVVLTAGGSKDKYFGRLLAGFIKRKVYAMFDKNGNPITETTTLGAAISGKAAYLKMHPYDVDVSSLGITYKELKPFDDELVHQLNMYKKQFFREIEEEIR